MTDKQKVVIDTSVFMQSILEVEKLIEDYQIVMPMMVLEELDRHKDGINGERAFKGRRAIRFINNNYDKFAFDMDESDDKPDNQIVDVAVKHNAIVCTLDVCMKVKAKNRGLSLIEVEENIGVYKGYRYLEINTHSDEDNSLLAQLYEKPEENILDLHINEYVIIKDVGCPEYDANYDEIVDYKTIDIMRWDGREYRRLKTPPKKIVTPLNDLQSCALDLLFNKDIPIKIIAGTYGSGKTLLSTLVGVHMVEDKGLYPKLVLVRNNDTGAGKDIGFLPGTIEDKTGLLFKTTIQHFPQGEYQAEQMKMAGRLETHIPYFIKGLSINGYIIVDESEDLTTSDIKLIGSRVENEGCLVFCGDWNQANGKYKTDSGMLRLIHKTKHEPLVGVIVLDEDVRSDASKVFADLI